MGNPSNEICGLLNRTANLYNNKLFSDIQFRIKDTDGEVKVFYAHTLILAMAGEKFAQMFYESNRGPYDPLSVAGFTPYVFDLMLKYLYTNKIRFASLDDAMDVFKLAHRFAINDLMIECKDYLLQFQVDHNSVFAKYDCALAFQNRELLGVCRKLVSSNTKAAFESPYFYKASKWVIEDILTLRDLSVSSELEVIEAALQWCKAECRRKNRSTDSALYIRECFLPLCKYLRFLTLEIQEFLDFEERNKIFTSPECISLTAKILSKMDPKLTVPTEFCALRASRCSTFAGNSAPNGSLHGVKTNDAMLFNFSAQSNGGTNFGQTSSNEHQILKYSLQSNGAGSVRQKNPNELKVLNSYSPSLQIYAQPKSASISNDVPVLRFPAQSNVGNNFRQTSPKIVSPPNMPTYPSVKYEAPQTSPSESNGEPLYEFLPQRKNAPVLRVMPQKYQKSVMSYEFPLREMQKEIGSCFESDVKCHSTIKMLRGTILIHEIELRIKDLQKNTEEEIEVHLCFSNNSAPKSYTEKVQLKNSVLQLPFSEPIKVVPNNPLDIEVMIESLKLNRCSVCRSQESRCELNCGLYVTAEIALRSNQFNGTDSFFFLISKIIYSVPKY